MKWSGWFGPRFWHTFGLNWRSGSGFRVQQKALLYWTKPDHDITNPKGHFDLSTIIHSVWLQQLGFDMHTILRVFLFKTITRYPLANTPPVSGDWSLEWQQQRSVNDDKYNQQHWWPMTLMKADRDGWRSPKLGSQCWWISYFSGAGI